MEYNISLWKDCNFDPEQFYNQIESFKDNSIVNFFCAEEYEIKLNEGSRGWEVIDKFSKKNISWNFIFNASEINYYLGRYHDEWNNKTTSLWPTFFINRSAYYLKNRPAIKKQSIDYLFISMLNLPREYRCFLMDNIFKNNLNDVSALTWHQTNTDYRWKHWTPEKKY